jgi:hypothetical protein
MTAAVAASRDLILLIVDGGSTVSLVDMPALAWLVDESGVAAPGPVIAGTLPSSWAYILIEKKRAAEELIGAPYVSATMSNQSFRGSFRDFLTWLVATTGKPVVGTGLTGELARQFWHWAAG